MCPRINKLSLWVLLLALLPHAGLAEPDDEGFEAADARWVPSLSFSGGIMLQDMDSSVESECALGRPEEEVVFVVGAQATVQTRPACRDPSHILEPLFMPGDPTVGNLRPPVDESVLATTPFVGAALQLMSPRLELLPGGPRAFVSGEVVTFWPPDRQIAREGVPTGVQFPPPQSDTERQAATSFQADALFGVGSSTTSEVQTLGFSARTGLAFPFHFRDRRLWIKPSVGWLRFGVDVEGTVIAGLKDDGFGLDEGLGAAQLDLRRGPGIRAINLTASGDKTFNGIGPGVELELEAKRFGRFGVSVFASADAYRVLGDRSVGLSDSVTCDPPAQPCLSGLINEAEGRVAFPPPGTAGDLIIPAGTPVPEVGVVIPDIAPFGPFGADTYTASWEFSVDSWAYRAGVGIRIHWLGR